MTALDSECNVCFEETSKDDNRKGKKGKKQVAKMTLSHMLTVLTRNSFFSTAHPSGILNPVDYTSFVSQGTHSTPSTKVEFP